jgi:hypothetical protein
MNPFFTIARPYMYMPWTPTAENKLKKEALALGIPGLIDVEFSNIPGEGMTITPKFDTDENYAWYLLKYVNTL